MQLKAEQTRNNLAILKAVLLSGRSIVGEYSVCLLYTSMRMAWRTEASVSMVDTLAMDWIRIGFSPPNGVFPILTTDDLRRL